MSLAESCFQQRVLYFYVDGRAGSMRPVLAMLTQAILEFHISLASVSYVLGLQACTILHITT